MIRIVMGNRQLFGAGAFRDCDGLFPTAMAPAFFLLELFRRVLRLVNEKVGASSQLDDSLINGITMFHIRAKHQDFAIDILDAIAISPTRMVVLRNRNFDAVGDEFIGFGLAEDARLATSGGHRPDELAVAGAGRAGVWGRRSLR